MCDLARWLEWLWDQNYGIGSNPGHFTAV